MSLGTIMQNLSHEHTALEAFVALGDIVLVAQVDATAAAFEEDRGTYLSGAVRRFALLAKDEDWLKLMNTLERSDAPAADSLRTMVRWSIDRDTVVGRPDTRCMCGGREAARGHVSFPLPSGGASDSTQAARLASDTRWGSGRSRGNELVDG